MKSLVFSVLLAAGMYFCLLEFHRSEVCRGGVDLQDPCPLTVPGVDVEPARQS